MKKFLLAAFCVLPLAMPVAAHAESARLAQLTTVIGDFQAGFAYWAHCNDFDKEKTAHPHYIANWNTAFDAYIRQIEMEHPDASADDIGQAILKKTNAMKMKLAGQYHDKRACAAPDTDTVRQHIQMFDGQTPTQMNALLNSIGG